MDTAAAGSIDEAVAAFWEDRYGQQEQIWSGKVNPVFAEVVADLAPGTALDLGCGEGGDVLWLAERGWRATGVDVARTALDRARARADEVGLADRTSWERHDLSQTFPAGRYDLVSGQFFQSPVALPRAEVLRRAAALVEPGGTLVLVSHAAPPPGSAHHRTDVAFPTPASEQADLGEAVAGWEVVQAEVVEREATAPGHEGKLSDTVLVVRRPA